MVVSGEENILRRSRIRVIYIDSDNTALLKKITDQYKVGIKDGEVMVVAGKEGDVVIKEIEVPNHTPYLETIRYYDDIIYKEVGVPKVILGGSDEFTEASSKIGYLTFEQVYAREQKLLETDIAQQLFIDVKFSRPQSLKDDVQDSEEKNTGQVGFQPNETQTQVGRTE